MEVVMTTGAIKTCKSPGKSSPSTNQHSAFCKKSSDDLMPFLSPNQQCRSTEGKNTAMQPFLQIYLAGQNLTSLL